MWTEEECEATKLGGHTWIRWQLSYAPKGPDVNSRGRKPVEKEQKKTAHPKGVDEAYPRMETVLLCTPALTHLRSYRP